MRERFWKQMKSGVAVLTVLCASSSSAFAATDPSVLTETQELRATIAQLEKRLTELEAKEAQNAAAVQAVQAAPAVAAATPDSKLISDAIADKISFHGYFRAGVGLNGKGTDQTTFKAPGAGSKYRLGNEHDNYGELIFGTKTQESPTDAYFRTETMISFASDRKTNDPSAPNNDTFALREAFVEAGNLDFLSPETKVWVGRRYYMRNDSHMADYFYLDMSGNGAGIMDIPVADDFAKAAFATIISSNTSKSANGVGSPSKVTADARLYDIKAPLGKVTVWTAVSDVTKNGTYTEGADSYFYEKTMGYNVGAMHQTDTLFGLEGFNKVALLYGVDAGADFTADLVAPAANNAYYGLTDRQTWSVVDHGLAQFNEKTSMMYSFVHKTTDNDRYADGQVRWTSMGVRPMYAFTKNFAIAVEPGVDYVDNGVSGYHGTLSKFTIAPEIRPNMKLMGRPVLRLYATYAQWSKDFNGANAGGVNSAYRYQTAGSSAGFQVENWW